MAYIDIVSPDEAMGIVKEEYEKGSRRAGKVSNILKVMSRSPEALKASTRLYLTVMYGKSELSRAQREMLGVVVSQANRCRYWTESHGEDFRAEVKNDELADHLKHDWRSAELSDLDQALCEWAVKLTLRPGEMTREDVEALIRKGLSEKAISDGAQVVGYFNYINRIADGLGVDLEPEMKDGSLRDQAWNFSPLFS